MSNENKTITQEEDSEIVSDAEPKVVAFSSNEIAPSKIYLNGELLGSCENPKEFTQEIRPKTRAGYISH